MGSIVEESVKSNLDCQLFLLFLPASRNFPYESNDLTGRDRLQAVIFDVTGIIPTFPPTQKTADIAGGSLKWLSL